MPENLSLTLPFNVTTFDVDFQNNLRIDSIFNFLQESAVQSADSLGWGYHHLIKERKIWNLSRINLELFRNVKIDEKIFVKTYPKGVDGVFALRDYILYDEKNEIFGKSESGWIMVNLDNMRPTKTDELLKMLSFSNPDTSSFTVPAKIKEPAEKKLNYTKEIKYSDIDIYRHTNNVKYVQMIYDCYTLEELQNKQTEFLQINYIHQLKCGETVEIYRSESNNEIYFEGVKNQNQKTFQALLRFKHSINHLPL